MKLRIGIVVIAFVCLALSLVAQSSNNSSICGLVPRVIQFGSVATKECGTPTDATVFIAFSLSSNAQGGATRCTETQSVSLDSSGYYPAFEQEIYVANLTSNSPISVIDGTTEDSQ